VALQCTFCGTALKDDARYCNSCGTLIASHPFSPKSTASSTSPAEQANTAREPLREQIAQQPPYRSDRRSKQEEPPSWLSQLEDRLDSKAPSGALESEWGEKSPDKRMVAKPENLREKTANHFTEPPAYSWPQQSLPRIEPEVEPEARLTEDDPEDLPTRPLVAGSPGIQRQRNDAHSPPDKSQHARFNEVEYVDTVPLVTQMKVKPASAPRPEEETFQQQERPVQQRYDTPNRTSYPGFTPPPPMHSLPPSSHPVQEATSAFSGAPMQEWKQTPPLQSVVSPVPDKKGRGSRKPLVIALVLLFLLVIAGGVGTWIVLYQPFSVPGITQPQQRFSDSTLGLSFLYPSGWQLQVDQRKATIHLFDSSHTAQVDIVVGTAQGGDIGQYLQQKANQLGLTGIKNGSTRSFAGAVWQQIQGNVQQSGASYSETLLATTHKISIITIMMVAPQATFAQEQQIAFSGIYSSFQFI
jgi:hypothetical protein